MEKIMISNQHESTASKIPLFPCDSEGKITQDLSQESLKKISGGGCIGLPGCPPWPYPLPEKLTPELFTLGN
jgi:hypothetical protein